MVRTVGKTEKVQTRTEYIDKMEKERNAMQSINQLALAIDGGGIDGYIDIHPCPMGVSDILNHE